MAKRSGEKENEAYQKGRAAAERGAHIYEFQPSYAKRPREWSYFQLGFYDATRDIRRAREEKQNVR